MEEDSYNLDYTFDDIYLPSDTEDFLNSLPFQSSDDDPDPLFFPLSPDTFPADDSDFLNLPEPDSFHNSLSPEFPNGLVDSVQETFPDSIISENSISNSLANTNVYLTDPSGVPSSASGSSGNSVSPVSYDLASDKVDLVNVSHPDFTKYVPSVNGSFSDLAKEGDSPDSDYPSPAPASSHGSGNSGNFVSPRYDPRNGVVDQKVKVEEEFDKLGSKRKKRGESLDFSDPRSSKYRKAELEEVVDGNLDGDEKRMARLMRNRESAQLSRQRKKHYVEELEDKVRAMHSTIQDLNTRISYVMAENASLRQQTNGAPPPVMYPHPPMGYPWVPCPPYMVKPQGSQVPLVPIPRLKPHLPSPSVKAKRVESKKSESKTKKVASVSLLGLLFFMLLFGGLMPMVNLKFREMNESVSGRLEFFNNRVMYDQRKGRVLESLNSSDNNIEIENDFQCGKGTKLDGEKGSGNLSEPLVASLYVPRNDKLVKIDGNLIIHSVMASEKAMASTKERGVIRSEETGLAVARSNVPKILPFTGGNTHTYRGPAERLIGEKDKLMSSATDGKLQQWFKEGLAGPMLSSGMCTEVFQFDTSPTAGAIVPAPVVNVSSETQHPMNITSELVKGRNRRILHGAPVPLVGSKSNVTQKPAGIDPEKDSFGGNSSLSSMVVSVLVDPREAGDGDGDGVMGPKSISRIFVVVLIDSVKYVTYSCMLPLIGSGAHLVTT